MWTARLSMPIMRGGICRVIWTSRRREGEGGEKRGGDGYAVFDHEDGRLHRY